MDEKRYTAYMDWLVLVFATGCVISAVAFMAVLVWRLFTLP